ncbi:MAG: sugar isomerase [Christensenellaceae bacterium]|nr:sugar isomerase [Christensenellaceae bacterium]
MKVRLKDRYDSLCEIASARGLDIENIKEKLKKQVIELPSWAVGNSGTRYGTFREQGAARHIWDKIDDCAEIQRVLGVCPVMASHVCWDKTEDGRYAPVREYAQEKGLRIGTLHPNTFLGQEYRFGSICSPQPETREMVRKHLLECVDIAREMGSKCIGMWVADGTNYPGQDSLRERKHRLYEGLKVLYDAMDDDMRMLLEYKPFEPFFYTTDVCDWGVSMLNCQKLGPRAKVLVDLGHHLHGVNVEHIVSTLLDEGMLGGFHFNNHRYADDDLITGTVQPFDLFMIYKEIIDAELDGLDTDITYMLDQSHNIEPSIEGIIYSVMNIQTSLAKALMIDRKALREAQENYDVIMANKILMEAFETDVEPLLAVVREEMGLEDVDPIANYRRGGYAEKIARERGNTGINTLGG